MLTETVLAFVPLVGLLVGTSNTDSFQTDGPDAPTGLSATSFPTFIKIVVALPSYFERGSVVEVWEYTASTPFSSATKVAEGTTDTFYIAKRDTTTGYFWARIRNPAGALSGTYPATTGQSGVADQIQTSDIAAGAVLDVFQTTAAGPTEVTSTSGAYQNVIFYNVPSYSFPTTQIITFQGSASLECSASFKSSLSAMVNDSLNVENGAGATETLVNTAFSQTQKGAFSFEYSSSVPASTARQYIGRAGAYDDGSGLNHGIVKDMLLKIEVHKRG